jgi:hypothetical protein
MRAILRSRNGPPNGLYVRTTIAGACGDSVDWAVIVAGWIRKMIVATAAVVR